MLDPKRILADPDAAKAALDRRGQGTAAELEPFFELEQARRELIRELDEKRAERNCKSKQIGGAGSLDDSARASLRELSNQIKALEPQLVDLESRRDAVLLRVPNLPHDSVPDGTTALHNREILRFGEPPKFDFAPQPHHEIGVRLGILDFERAAKISGARFCVLRGAGARLERALIQYMLDLHTREHGCSEIWPPFLVKPQAMEGTGQLPKFDEDAFKTDGREFYLVPTAEVPVTNMHREEILDARLLPLRYCAYTPCFRAEAGSYGRDVKGLIRQHQFDKVELVSFCQPEQSYAELERLRGAAEQVLKNLGLHYRVVELCAGDLGANAAKCYDLEVWLPAEGAYREISSCSNFEDYQARRAQIRYKEGTGKPHLVHTLNGSALAVGRTMVAILEQCQKADGTVAIPAVLRPYMGMEAIS